MVSVQIEVQAEQGEEITMLLETFILSTAFFAEHSYTKAHGTPALGPLPPAHSLPGGENDPELFVVRHPASTVLVRDTWEQLDTTGSAAVSQLSIATMD